jgi:hypothetical protein
LSGTLTLHLDHPLLAGRTGRGVTVAVIDSGVHPRHPHIRLATLGRLLGIAPDGTVHEDAVDRLGHGTAVTAAIQEKAPDAALHVIRIFHDRLSTTATALVAALDRAIALDARLINLSLGTVRTGHAAALRSAVGRAVDAGAIIVSASEHAGAPCYPGSVDGAAGVWLDAACPRAAIRLEAGRLHASGQPRPIPGVPPERNLCGVSFAVANCTGVLACLLQARPELRTMEDVMRLITTTCEEAASLRRRLGRGRSGGAVAG